MHSLPRRAWMLLIAATPAVLAAVNRKRDQPSTEVWLGGDVHLGESGGGVLSAIAPLLAGAVGIVNIEGPISTRRSKMSNHPNALKELRAASVLACGIANNHESDLGPESAVDSMHAVENAQLLPVGGPAGAASIVRSDLRLMITAHDLGKGVPPNLGMELALARQQGSALISTFHVTGAPSYLPRPELVRAVDIAVSAGACLVAAHGTHQLARIERRGRVLIAWGLGNLAFACDCTHEQDGLIVRATLGRDGVGAAMVTPIVAGLQGRVARARENPRLVFDLLRSLGSTPLEEQGASARV